jgi:dihydrofolate reductase
MQKNVSIIAAVGKNNEIGLDNKLLWKLPDDLKRFQKLTKGHAVIMGRKTFESIGKPLPERKNIVVTRQSDYKAQGCTVVRSLEAALEAAGDDDEPFVIGGSELYDLALPYANKLYLTFVDAEPEADVYFPELDVKEWKFVSKEEHAADERHIHAFTFTIYERK